MLDVYFFSVTILVQLVTQAYSEKENPSCPNRRRTYDLPITGLDALPLSYRRRTYDLAITGLDALPLRFDSCWKKSDFLFSSMPVSLTEKITSTRSLLFSNFSDTALSI